VDKETISVIPNWPSFTPHPGRKRVALVGFSASSLHLVPWQDPTVELWGLNQAYINFERRPDRWFEIHRPESRADVAVPTYLDDLKTIGCPLYMIAAEPIYPTSVKYPLEEVQAVVPPLYRSYFTSGVSYMIALAVKEGFEEIALYGIDCAAGTEYVNQRPCVEAWCSLATGRGINVVIPPQSALFKAMFLYGYEAPRKHPPVLRASTKFFTDRIAEYKMEHNDLLVKVHQIEGSIHELENLLGFAESASRGTVFPPLERTT
jgi:hypothetical protein